MVCFPLFRPVRCCLARTAFRDSPRDRPGRAGLQLRIYRTTHLHNGALYVDTLDSEAKASVTALESSRGSRNHIRTPEISQMFVNADSPNRDRVPAMKILDYADERKSTFKTNSVSVVQRLLTFFV